MKKDFNFFKNNIKNKIFPTFKELVDAGNLFNASFFVPSVAQLMAQEGIVFSINELTILENLRKGEGGAVAVHMAGAGNYISASDFLQLNPSMEIIEGYAYKLVAYNDQVEIFTELMTRLRNSKHGRFTSQLIFLMAKYGFEFSVDELISYGNPADLFGSTSAHWMARNGYMFTFSAILRLGNHPDAEGATIAHWMARNGHKFTINELLSLGNPATEKTPTFRFEGDIHITATELDYQNKNGIAHDGGTVAHIMAREGHRFTVAEIKALDNPRDANGMTIADWMAKTANPLPSEDLGQLKQ